MLARAVPVAPWLRGYRREWLRADVVAGLAAGAVVVPQAMAYATIADQPVQVGLYTCMVPMVVYALLGGSRTLSVSTTSTIATLTASTLLAAEVAARSSDPAGDLAMLTILVGAVLLVARVARLGVLVENISDAVVIGLKVGVGLTVAAGQLPKLLGVPSDVDADTFFTELGSALRHLGDVNTATVLLAAGTITALVVLARFTPRIPAPLVAVVGGILLVEVASLPDHGVSLIAKVPEGLPLPVAPSFAHVGSLVPGAIAIALMAYLETVSVARGVRRASDAPIDNDQELVANGLAAVAGGFFRSLPPAGGFSQTAVNIGAGARSQLSAIVTVVLAVAAALFLGPVLSDLPQATLGAVVIVAVIGLIRPAEIVRLARVNRLELLVAGVTAAVGLAAGLLPAVGVGVVLTLLLVLVELDRPTVTELRVLPDGSVVPDAKGERIAGLLVLRVDAPLYSANARAVQRQILRAVDASDPKPVVVLVDVTAVAMITTTILGVMQETLQQLDERAVRMWVAALPERALRIARTLPHWADWTNAMYPTVAEGVAAYRRRPSAGSGPPR